MATVLIDGDVRDAWLETSFGSGSAKRSNPQRPTIDLGNGQLRIRGYDSDMRKPIEVREGTAVLFKGWVQNQVKDEITDISRYQIEGLPFQRGRTTVDITQTSATANSSDTAVQSLLRDAFGASSVDVDVSATPLSVYSYRGGAAGYASRYALVSGGLPFATTVGGIGVRDPSRVPESVPMFSSSSHRIRSLSKQFIVDQLWNAATIKYVPASTVEIERAGRMPGSAVTFTTTLPELGDGESYLDSSLSLVIDRVYINNWTTNDPANSGTNKTSAFVTPANVTISNVAISGRQVTATLTSSAFTWRQVHNQLTPNPTRSGFSFSYNNQGTGYTTSVSITAAVRVSITKQAPERMLDATNPESIAEWDERRLDNMPAWFASTAQSALQTRIDVLAKPRNIHRVVFYVDQRDAAKTQQVVDIQSGDHIAISDVGQNLYVMHAEYRLSQRTSDLKILTCIESEALPDSAPSTPNAPNVSAPSTSSIIATWIAPSNGGQPITQYDARFRTGSGSWTTVSNVTSPWTRTGLQASTTYEVQVRATNSVGTSEWSASGSATTQAPSLSAPGIPINFTGTALSDSSIQWRWGAPASGGAVESYTLRWNESGTDRSDAVIVTGITGLGHALTGLTASTTYEARVRAVNSAGESAQVAWLSVTTLDAPPSGPDNPLFLGSSANPVYIGSTANRVGLQ